MAILFNKQLKDLQKYKVIHKKHSSDKISRDFGLIDVIHKDLHEFKSLYILSTLKIVLT